MASPTNVNFDDLAPQPKPDTFNVEWQGSVPVDDPNSPGNQVREVSACYRVPPVGGNIVLTADYQLGAPDSGVTFICNSSVAITITLPPTIPQLPNPQGVWNVKIKNFGVGLVTVDPNGLDLDNSATPVTLLQNNGFEISTDNANYWTFGKFGPTPTITAEAATGAIDGANLDFSISTAGTIVFLVWNGQVRFDFTQTSPTTFTTGFVANTNDILYAVYTTT